MAAYFNFTKGSNIKMAYTGWIKKDNNWYYYKADKKQTGWLKNTDNRWYYLQANTGIMRTGWINYKGKQCYLAEKASGKFKEGQAYQNITVVFSGVSYKFDNDCYAIKVDNSLVSDSLINFVKSYEGFSAIKYKDAVGVLTQGYGLTGKYIANLPASITEEKATELLKEVINKDYAFKIKADLDSKGITLKQWQFDALVSMSYNIGTAGLLSSTLYKRICAGVRNSSLKDNFIVWSNAGGKRLQGLYNRRVEEYNMFMYSDYKRDL